MVVEHKDENDTPPCTSVRPVSWPNAWAYRDVEDSVVGGCAERREDDALPAPVEPAVLRLKGIECTQ
jgi:hypothetical protein